MKLRIDVWRESDGLYARMVREGRPEGLARKLDGRDERSLLWLTDRLERTGREQAPRCETRWDQVCELCRRHGYVTAKMLSEYADIPLERATGYLQVCAARKRLDRASAGVFTLPKQAQEAAE